MNPQRLVSMANDIAAFFEADPDRDAAAAAVASHLRRFWEPRMRRELLAHHAGGGEGLSPLAVRAVALLGAQAQAQA